MCVCVHLPYNLMLTFHLFYLSAGEITSDTPGVFHGTGNATFTGVLENSVGESFIGKYFTEGTFKAVFIGVVDEVPVFADLGSDGSVSFFGKYMNEHAEFEGLVSTDGGSTLDVDSSIRTLSGEVKVDGNLTSPSEKLFTNGTYFTAGSLQIDESSADLGGEGFEEFTGTSNSGVLTLKNLGFYANGAFTGSVRTEGSRVLNEDDTVTLEGSVFVNGEPFTTGSQTFDFSGLLLESFGESFGSTLEKQFEDLVVSL